MAPRSRPKRHKSADSTCVLTKDNEIRLTGHGFLVDGVMRPNLDDCKLEPGVKFEVLYDQLDDEPVAKKPTTKKVAAKVAPQSDEDAVTVIHAQSVTPVAQPTAQVVPQEQKHIKLPAELQELQELIEVYQDAQGAGPYVAIAVVAAYLYRKLNKKRQDEDRCDCEECRARRRADHRTHHAEHRTHHAEHRTHHAEHRTHHAEHRTHHAEHRPHHAEPPCSCAECVPPAPVAAETEER